MSKFTAAMNAVKDRHVEISAAAETPEAAIGLTPRPVVMRVFLAQNALGRGSR